MFSGNPFLRLFILYIMVSLAMIPIGGVIWLTFRDGFDLIDALLLLVAIAALAGAFYVRRQTKG